MSKRAAIHRMMNNTYIVDIELSTEGFFMNTPLFYSANGVPYALGRHGRGEKGHIVENPGKPHAWPLCSWRARLKGLLTAFTI